MSITRLKILSIVHNINDENIKTKICSTESKKKFSPEHISNTTINHIKYFKRSLEQFQYTTIEPFYSKLIMHIQENIINDSND